jgi:hypothetical protein
MFKHTSAIMVAGVAVEARLASFAVLAVRAVQTIAAHTGGLIAALAITRVHVAVALAALARAALLERSAKEEYGARVAAEALVALLAAAGDHLGALVQGARARELIAVRTARTHALLAGATIRRVTVKSVQASLLVKSMHY